MSDRPEFFAGAPLHNPWLYRRAPFHMGDPMALMTLPGDGVYAILRDIELDRFRQAGIADHSFAPAEFAPASGLSGDRETATAQAAAELLTQKGVREIWTDRSCPMIFAHEIESRGVQVHCDPELGVLERRAKTEEEVEHLRTAQSVTENAVRFACELIANATADADGRLVHEGEALTSERVVSEINIWLLRHGMGTSGSIVAGGADGADCHNRGSGPLRTGELIIIDVFPMHLSSRYFGDCTRTVVHGQAPRDAIEMHAAVIAAKAASIQATRAGVTGDAVHKAATDVIESSGYALGLPSPKESNPGATMPHGTGHGVGLEVHEPPLLDKGGPALVRGDCLTIEPGLYKVGFGGVRVEDMVIVTDDGCENLNSISEGLYWR